MKGNTMNYTEHANSVKAFMQFFDIPFLHAVQLADSGWTMDKINTDFNDLPASWILQIIQ